MELLQVGEWKEEGSIGNSPRQKEATAQQKHGELPVYCARPGSAVERGQSVSESCSSLFSLVQVERHFPALTRWRISKGNINIYRLKKEKGKGQRLLHKCDS